VFFFEKKNQKTFASLSPPRLMAAGYGIHTAQKF
jgi:hypothetical protein